MCSLANGTWKSPSESASGVGDRALMITGRAGTSERLPWQQNKEEWKGESVEGVKPEAIHHKGPFGGKCHHFQSSQ